MAKKTVKKTEAQAEPKKAGTRRAITGTVISNKMDKTIVVQVMRMVKHPMYGKYQRHYSKMYVHDVDNQTKEGDVVRIKQVRPLSKLKSWTLVEVVRRAEAGAEDNLT
jgi:small subunit ribosomal protein S17